MNELKIQISAKPQPDQSFSCWIPMVPKTLVDNSCVAGTYNDVVAI